MKSEYIFKNMDLEWCPRADLNHRHADFQSAALPLSYSGIRKVDDLLMQAGLYRCQITMSSKEKHFF